MKLTLLFVLLVGLVAPAPTQAQITYPRAGWVAKLSTNAHGVRGFAEIVDARTVRLTHFYYDGGGPAVYAYLAPSNTNSAFETGLVMEQRLNGKGAYTDSTITLTLPITGPNLDNVSAISIWCADFKVNFGSGSFMGNTFLPIVLKAPDP
jgi:hypothetical protein